MRRHTSTALVVLFVFLGGTGCSFRPWRGWGHDDKGLASWYGNEYHGRTTASGAVFDENAMTAAHKTLPFGTIVRVKNLKNGRTVDVRITDRGPFVRGRIIDLSKGAARRLDMIVDGVVPCRIEVLRWGHSA